MCFPTAHAYPYVTIQLKHQMLRKETGSEHFPCQDSDLSQIFKLIVHAREQILNINTSVVEWRQVT